MKNIFLFLFVAGLLYSCDDAEKQAAVSTAGSTDTPKEFSGVFTGLTPCADCPGIYTVTDFSKDQRYFESLKYLERNAQFADSGRWSWSVNDSIISVTSAKDSSLHYYQLLNDSTIRMLDADKQPITGQLEQFYLLKKKDTLLQR